jgi:hypothetical protein
MADREIAFRLACVLVVGLAILHRGHFVSSDELGLYFQTRALSEDLSLAVPPRIHMAAPGRDGRSYSHYTIGQSLLAVPFHAAGRLVEPLLSDGARRALEGELGQKSWAGAPPVGFGAFPILFYPLAATGVLAALFFLFERRLGASRGAALTASAVLATCTHAGTLSTFFLQHTTEAIGALGAFYCWHRFRGSGAPRDVLLGSVFASSILNVRAAGAISGLALGGYLGFVFVERMRRGADRRWLATATLGTLFPALASGALYLLVNQLKWGDWLESPMLAERSIMGVDPRPALVGFLVSPGMSLFVYSPVLLLLPATLPRFWRAHGSEVWTILALFASNLLFYASYQLWTGLFSCPGPRYLFTSMVFLMLPLGPWLDRARGAVARSTFVALIALGASVQVLSSTVSWGDLVIREGYRSWRPAFGFLFELGSSPLAAAARHFGDPGYVDAWVARIALGWRGQAPAPRVAVGVMLVWGAVMLLLVLRLRRALRAEGPDASVPPHSGCASPAIGGSTA